MYETPKGSRLHIAIFGRRNAGKSSLINALTNQSTALVSAVAGTTTDPVYKAMEILPLGPVMIIDTAGIDDVGELGKLRVEKTLEVMRKTDVAIIVIDALVGITDFEIKLLAELKERNIKTITVINKIDQINNASELQEEWLKKTSLAAVAVSAEKNTGISEVKEIIIKSTPDDWEGTPLIGDLINPGDLIIMVVPIDTAAPKGRLILPQVQTIRDILDYNGKCLVVKENELANTLTQLKVKPALVVTDSQVFKQVNIDTPSDIKLTSFSILMARYKGDLESLIHGAKAIDCLKPNDKILIAEGCTHHKQEDDIGTVKIPNWLKKHVGGELNFTWVAGGGFPKDLTPYKLIIQCGGCMLNRREVLYRINQAREQNIPIVNYGILIAKIHGILPRVISPFGKLQNILDN